MVWLSPGLEQMENFFCKKRALVKIVDKHGCADIRPAQVPFGNKIAKKMYSSSITYKDDHFAKKWIKIG